MIKALLISSYLLLLIAGQNCNRQTVDLRLKLSPFIAIGDDSTLYFIYGFLDGQSIFSLNLKTNEVLQLTDRREYFNFLTISSDYSKIAYTTFEEDSINGSYSGIWIMNTDGTEKRMVRGVPSMIVGLSFSPNNDRLYFAGALEYKNYSLIAKPDFHNMDLLYTDTSGSKLELITNLGAYSVRGNRQVTLDGQYILTHITVDTDLMGAAKLPTDSITDKYELAKYFMLSNEDADIVQIKSGLTKKSHNFLTPFYSPDEQTIYYYEGWLIFKKRKGKPIRLLFDSSKNKVNGEYGIRTVTISPDGKHLYVVKQNGPSMIDTGIYILNSETGEVVDEIVLDMSSFGSVVAEDAE